MNAEQERIKRGESVLLESQVDLLCDEFEDAIRSRQVVSIRNVLARVPEESWTVIFRHLLHIELECRQVLGDSVDKQRYLEDFPEYAGVVEEVFETGATLSQTCSALSAPYPRSADRVSLAKFVGPALSSRYQIKSEVGRGAMGAVYRCLDKRLDRHVAIKVLLPGQSTDRFCREAKLMAKLNSPYVVKIHDFEPFRNGSAMISMEWICGTDLAKRIRGGREGLDEVNVLPWMRDTCAGMIAAAEQGVIHRDLKPSNILIDDNDRAKVGDFGLASSAALVDDLTQGGSVLGTPLYMAPEQAEDPRGVDTRADIYSFGATYYHAVTGSPPFTGETAFSIQYKHRTEPLIPPKARQPAISQHLNEILERCLAKSPTERFQTFADVLAQLSNLGGEGSPWDMYDDDRLQAHVSRYRDRRDKYLGETGEGDFDDEYRLPGGRSIRVLRGDLVKQSVDAVVSSDDEQLTMGGGVSWRLSTAAGPNLATEARNFVPVRAGRAVVTSAGRLPARFVFHGVTLDGDQPPSRDLIVEIMRSCFYHADTLHVRSLAFPLLGTGAGGFSRGICLDTMFRFALRTLAYQPTAVREVRLVLYAKSWLENGPMLTMARDVAGQAMKSEPLPKGKSDEPSRSVWSKLHDVLHPRRRSESRETPEPAEQCLTEKSNARVRIVSPVADSIQRESRLVIGVLGDFSGVAVPGPSLDSRQFIEVDKANFDSVLRQIGPSLGLSEDGTVTTSPTALHTSICFAALADFDALRLAESVEPARGLFERSRNAENDPECEVLRQSGRTILQSLLHSAPFSSLEARWRGLRYLANAVADYDRVELHLLDISKAALKEDFASAGDCNESFLYGRICERLSSFNQAPFAFLVGDYEFSNHPDDVRILMELSAIAADLHTPFIAGAAPQLFAVESFSDLTPVHNPGAVFRNPEYSAWNAFRECPDSRYVGLTVPRILLRAPYEAGVEGGSESVLEERKASQCAPAGLWGNAAYAFAAKAAEAFQKHGWLAAIRGYENGVVRGLPVVDTRSVKGRLPPSVSVDWRVPECWELPLHHAGIVALLQFPAGPTFVSANSCHKPEHYYSEEARVDSRISSQLPHVLCTSHFAHHIQAIARDCLSTSGDVMKIQAVLNEWLEGYCVSSAHQSDKGNRETVRPFQDGRVEITEDSMHPGCYTATVYLRPVYQLPMPTTSIPLTVKLSSPVTRT